MVIDCPQKYIVPQSGYLIPSHGWGIRVNGKFRGMRARISPDDHIGLYPLSRKQAHSNKV